MSSGVEVEGGRVRMLFEKASAPLIGRGDCSDGLTPVQGEEGRLGNRLGAVDWVSDNVVDEESIDEAHSSPAVASASGDIAWCGDAVRWRADCTTENSMVSCLVSGESEPDRPPMEGNNSIASHIVLAGSAEQIPASPKLSQSVGVADLIARASEKIELLRTGLESNHAFEKPGEWSGPAFSNHGCRQRGEVPMVSIVETTTSFSDHEQIGVAPWASCVSQLVDALALDACGSHGESTRDCDVNTPILMTDEGSQSLVSGRGRNRRLDDLAESLSHASSISTASLAEQNGKEKAVNQASAVASSRCVSQQVEDMPAFHVEGCGSLKIKESPSDLPNNNSLGEVNESFLSLEQPQWPLFESYHGEFVSGQLNASRRPLIVDINVMDDVEKPSGRTILSSSSCCVDKHKEYVKEFSANGTRHAFHMNDEKAAVALEELQSLGPSQDASILTQVSSYNVLETLSIPIESSKLFGDACTAKSTSGKLSLLNSDHIGCFSGLSEKGAWAETTGAGQIDGTGNVAPFAGLSSPISWAMQNGEGESRNQFSSVEEKRACIPDRGEISCTLANGTSCSVNSSLAIHSTLLASISPRNPVTQNGEKVAGVVSDVEEEKSAMLTIAVEPCKSEAVVGSFAGEASEATQSESLKSCPELLSPIAGSLKKCFSPVSCEEHGSVSKGLENGMEILIAGCDNENTTEPGGPVILTSWQLENNDNTRVSEYPCDFEDKILSFTVEENLHSTGIHSHGVVEEESLGVINAVSPISDTVKLFSGASKDDATCSLMLKSNIGKLHRLQGLGMTRIPASQNKQAGTATELLVLKENNLGMLDKEETSCCLPVAASCSVAEDTPDLSSRKMPCLRSSPRLTRKRNAARQCGETLEAISISLRKSRKKRSSLEKHSRNSSWGSPQNIVLMFPENGRLLKCVDMKSSKVPRVRLTKGKSVLRGRRRYAQNKGSSNTSKGVQGDATNQVHLMFKMDGQVTSSKASASVHSPISLQAGPSDCSPQMECQVVMGSCQVAVDSEAQLASHCLDDNTEKPFLSGEFSRDRDLESTLTQDNLGENDFGELNGVSSRVGTEPSSEAPNNRDLDASNSPESDVLHAIPGSDREAAVSPIRNNGSMGQCKKISENNVLHHCQALAIPELVLPLTKHKYRRKKANQNKKKADNDDPSSVEKLLTGAEGKRKDRKYAKCRHQQKAEKMLEGKSKKGEVHSLESKSSSSEVFEMHLAHNGVAESKHCQEVSKTEDLEALGPVQVIEAKSHRISRSCKLDKQKPVNSDSGASNHRRSWKQKSHCDSARRRKIKAESVSKPVVTKEEDPSVLSNIADLSKIDKVKNVKEVTSEDPFCSKILPVEGEQDIRLRPRAAWVRCDDCYRWRRISADLADYIEATNCKWTCKENEDKRFADCSIPQEKSNAEINAELEISDASGEEDSRCTEPRHKGFDLKQLAVTQKSSWTLIKHNLFLHRSRKTQTIDEIMVCHCNPPPDGSLGCRDECLNRMLNIECIQGTCPCGDLCSNQQFQKRKYAKFKWFRCGKKGYGLQLLEDVSKGDFLIEYIGEVLDLQTYEARLRDYASRGQKHFYFMTLNGSEVIDACAKGNLGRFINHSCDPNCRTEKWMVNGEVSIGLFALRDIKTGEEVTFDYNYVRVFGAAAKKCVCGSSECRGYIGGDPTNAEAIVQEDSDDEYPEPVMLLEDGTKVNLDEIIPHTEVSSEISDLLIELSPSVQKFDISCQTEDMGSEVPTAIPQSEFPLHTKDDEGKVAFNVKKLEYSLHKKDTLNEQLSNFRNVEDTCGLYSDPLQLDFSLSATGMECYKGSPASEKSKTSRQVERVESSSVSPINGQTKCGSPSTDRLNKITAPNLDIKQESLCGFQQLEATSLKTMNSLPSTLRGKNSKCIVEDKPKIANSTSRVKSSRHSTSIKKFKFDANKLTGHKPRRPTESMKNGRFEGVEEKLCELLDAEGRISKRKDATKGYLKLLFVTAASGDNIKGEASQSTRDLSIVLDALLKTKSRTVLVDIINKNGLQMLHNIMKQNRRNFNKIPIIRKLLKVIEYLAVKEVLTLDHINTAPPCAGMESFRESIMALAWHNDIQVHQMARNFRDRWIPRIVRKVYSDRDDGSFDQHNPFQISHRHWRDQGARPSDAIDCTSQMNHSSDAHGATAPPEACAHEGTQTDGTKRTRKRKSRWDQPEETNLALPLQPVEADAETILDIKVEASVQQPHISQELQSPVKMAKTLAVSPKVEAASCPTSEDAPPGFSSSQTSNHVPSKVSSSTSPNAAMGHPQPRYLPFLHVSHGIPWAIVQEFGTLESEGSDKWAVAPAMPFHPFPPLPPYPREASGFREEARQCQRSGQGSAMIAPAAPVTGGNNSQGNERLRWPSGNGRERRYFRQQKRIRENPPRPREKHWSFNGNTKNHLNGVNSVVCLENAKEEASALPCFKESVDWRSMERNQPPIVRAEHGSLVCQQQQIPCQHNPSNGQ